MDVAIVDVVPLEVVAEEGESPLPFAASTTKDDDFDDSAAKSSQQRQRFPRVFKIPLPCPLRLVDSSAAEAAQDEGRPSKPSPPKPVSDLRRAKVALVPAEAIREQYASLSRDCAAHGPRLTVVRGDGRVGRWLALPGLLAVAFAVAFLSLVLAMVGNFEVDNASLPGGGYWPFGNGVRTVASVLHQILIEGGNVGFIVYAVFQQFPLVSRRPRMLAFVLCSFGTRFALYLISKIHWLSADQRLVAKTVAFVPGYWFSYAAPFVISRECWRWWKRHNGKPTHPKWWWRGMLKPSGVVNIFANVGAIAAPCAFVLMMWDALGAVAIAIIAVVIAPGVFVLLWSFTQSIEFSAGHATAIPILWNMSYVMATFLDAIMAMNIGDGGAFWTMAKFFAFYLVFGAMFSIIQAVVSLATTSFESPQYLIVLQMFLETYMGLAFVSIQSSTAFWLTLGVQSLWALFQNTGLKADLYILARDGAVRGVSHREPVHTEEELLKRVQYFFMLNMQGILCDITNATVLPIIFLIDGALGNVWGLCTVSCSLDSASLRAYIMRYVIVLGFRLVAATIVVSSYIFRFWRMLKHSGSKPGIRAILSSMFASFQLHVLRNLFLFSACNCYLLSVFFPSPQIIGWSSSSSASLGSLSSQILTLLGAFLQTLSIQGF